MQLRHAEELEPAGDFTTQEVGGRIEHGQRILGVRPIRHGDADESVAFIGRNLHLSDGSRPHARIGQLEADQFSQFLAESFGYSFDTMVHHSIHSTAVPTSMPPKREEASRSTNWRTCSARMWSLETVTAPISARCHRSW